jgi:NADPH-dependent glutamate synthase beta subunit-like oxidoreductase
LVLSILVASPGDVTAERDAVVAAINQWNSEHSRKMKLHLEAVRWETHAYPATGGRPQGFVNQHMADDCDLAIAAFGARMGTPTGKAQSGTIEEIERLRSKWEAGCAVFLECSTAA